MILVDTGFWLAVANRADQYHATAQEVLSKINQPLVTTWPVVTETCYLLQSRLGQRSQIAFVDSLARGAFLIHPQEPFEAQTIKELLERYQDRPMDLADATLVLLAEQVNSGQILTTDVADFETYRWKDRRPFHNLLLR